MNRTGLAQVIWLFLLCSLIARAEIVRAEQKASQSPTGPVEVFHQTLIEIMKTQAYDQRLALLTPVIAAEFDTTTVARIALGRNWGKLSTDQQTTIKGLMAKVITSTYASRFPAYKKQYFELIGEQLIKPGRIIIRSKLFTGSKVVDMDYQLINRDGQWLIFDIIASGVSDLSLKRASYSDAFKSGGIEKVIKVIEQTVQDNSHKEKNRSD